jgi:hypothetical protein
MTVAAALPPGDLPPDARWVTARAYRCSACSEWVAAEEEIVLTRPLEHVSWVRRWVHPRCANPPDIAVREPVAT